MCGHENHVTKNYPNRSSGHKAGGATTGRQYHPTRVKTEEPAAATAKNKRERRPTN